MRRAAAAVVVLCAAALAACEGPSAPKEKIAADEAFRHALSGDVSGEYRPVAPVQIGDVGLDSVFIGQSAALEAWEQGRGGSAPVVVVLTTPGGHMSVGPLSYQITDDAVRFHGVGGKGLTVTLNARLDQGALATARRNFGDQTPVIEGTLSVGGRGAPVRLTPWTGD